MTILVTDQNDMIISDRDIIVQRSKLVDKLKFLVPPTYKDIDMTPFTVTLEYLLPVSKEYHIETLTLSDELYKEHLEYKLPVDTALTKEAGKIELQLSFTHVDVDVDGKQVQYVRKVKGGYLTIVPISAWSDIIPDASLTKLDQRLIAIDAMVEAINTLQQEAFESKADNIALDPETHELQLTSKGEKIGDKVKVVTPSFNDDDGSDDGILELSEYEGIEDDPSIGFIEL